VKERDRARRHAGGAAGGTTGAPRKLPQVVLIGQGVVTLSGGLRASVHASRCGMLSPVGWAACRRDAGVPARCTVRNTFGLHAVDAQAGRRDAQSGSFVTTMRRRVGPQVLLGPTEAADRPEAASACPPGDAGQPSAWAASSNDRQGCAFSATAPERLSRHTAEEVKVHDRPRPVGDLLSTWSE